MISTTVPATGWTVVLSSNCEHCRLFATYYISWLECEDARVVVVNDLSHLEVRDLLKLLRITRFPAIVYKKEIFEGADAYDKMQESTGVAWEGTKESTTTQELSSIQGIKAFMKNA